MPWKAEEIAQSLRGPRIGLKYYFDLFYACVTFWLVEFPHFTTMQART